MRAVSALAFAAGVAAAAPSVVFRLDDVQDYFRASASRDIMQLFVDRNEVLSIGVIGGAYFGQDAATVAAVTAASQAGSEVFNHGDDATTLYNAVTKAEALQHLQNAEVAAFKPYTSFVGHENRWNAATLEALAELNYNVISSSTTGDYPMPVDTTTDPLHLSKTTQTARLVGSSWVSSIGEVVGVCQTEVQARGVCVVMMHPQEFADGVVSLAELGDLVDEVKAQGWAVTTFRAYAAALGNTPSPGVDTPSPPQTPAPEMTPAPETPVPTPSPPSGANPWYPSWSLNHCLSDGAQPSWQETRPTKAACCAKWFQWNADVCNTQ